MIVLMKYYGLQRKHYYSGTMSNSKYKWFLLWVEVWQFGRLVRYSMDNWGVNGECSQFSYASRNWTNRIKINTLFANVKSLKMESIVIIISFFHCLYVRSLRVQWLPHLKEFHWRKQIDAMKINEYLMICIYFC